MRRRGDSRVFVSSDGIRVRTENIKKLKNWKNTGLQNSVQNTRFLSTMVTKMYKCTHCEYTTSKQSTFSMHMIMKHKAEKPHVCTDCGQRFSVRTQLQHHMKNHHNNSVIHCIEPTCTFFFKTDAGHHAHYVRHHMNVKELLCPIDMEEASITNERKRLMKCRHCTKVGLQSAMYYHLSVCHPSSPFVTEESLEIRDKKRRKIDDEQTRNDVLEDIDGADVSMMISEVSTTCHTSVDESSETSDETSDVSEEENHCTEYCRECCTESDVRVICPEGAYVETYGVDDNDELESLTSLEAIDFLTHHYVLE